MRTELSSKRFRAPNAIERRARNSTAVAHTLADRIESIDAVGLQESRLSRWTRMGEAVLVSTPMSLASLEINPGKFTVENRKSLSQGCIDIVWIDAIERGGHESSTVGRVGQVWLTRLAT